MSRSKASIEVVIDPVRMNHLHEFKAELAASKALGQRCEAEVLRRDEKGSVIRDGVLNLPSRADFACTSDQTTTMRDLKSLHSVDFSPVDLQLDTNLELTVFPFSWDEVQISFETGDDPKRLLRLRLWFLEWFQARHTSEPNELKGVVHSIRGPKHDGNIWHVCIDMGSAPTEALIELFHVLASRGVNKITLGAEMHRAEKEEL